MNVKLIVIIAILATSALAKHKCNGLSVDFKEALERIDKKQGNDVITTEHLQKRQESLASGNFRPIKILMDLSGLNEGLDSKGMSDRKAFYKQVFEITSKWWESALLVNDDRTSIWPTILKIQKESDIEAEKEYIDFKLDGRDTSIYDLFIKVNLAKNEEEGTLAYAGPYLRHDKTQRPISGSTFVTLFGDNAAKEHSTPVQYAVETMVHEFGHIFGFISWKQFQPNYVGKANGKYIWKGPKTLALAKEFYGCPTMEGVPLETLNGEVGGHWNEEILASEMMTPVAGDHGDRLADMSLALLEDTAWYKANYSVSENFTHGKGGGCAAVTGNVVANKPCPSPEACKSGAKDFITKDYKGLGYCETDAHGCNRVRMYTNRNCEVEESWPAKYKKELGAHYGDGCVVVTANLVYKATSATKIAGNSAEGHTMAMNNVKLPVYAWCEDDSKRYTLAFTKFEYDTEGKLTGHDAYVDCTKAGTVKFNEEWSSNESTVVCHNPEKFCAARFSSSTTSGALCDKSCNSYGRCQDVNYTANGGDSGDGTVPAGDGTVPAGDGTVPAGDGTDHGDGTVPAGDGTDHGDGTVPAGDGMGSGDHAGTDAGELQ